MRYTVVVVVVVEVEVYLNTLKTTFDFNFDILKAFKQQRYT